MEWNQYGGKVFLCLGQYLFYSRIPSTTLLPWSPLPWMTVMPVLTRRVSSIGWLHNFDQFYKHIGDTFFEGVYLQTWKVRWCPELLVNHCLSCDNLLSNTQKLQPAIATTETPNLGTSHTHSKKSILYTKANSLLGLLRCYLRIVNPKGSFLQQVQL